jgi:cation diffusion facilitator CzcD-associated flavoprotein CzcO
MWAVTGQTVEHFDVVVIGAGVMGLYALYRLRELGFRVRVYEEAEGVGGTWYWNRYPGCRFDTYSPVYSYSFSTELLQEWDWKETYSAQPDNECYLNFVADKLDLRRDIQLSTRVVSLAFDEEQHRWNVGLAGGHASTARFVIAAVGELSSPYLPNVPGLETFGGVRVHTGRWPKEGIALAGKRVAVIGTGSTGVQVVPEVAKVASQLVVFQRSATYCGPLRNRPIDAAEMRQIKASYPDLFCRQAERVNGVNLYPPHPCSAFDFSKEERIAFYEKIWAEDGRIGFQKLYREYSEPGPINDEFSEWFKDKIREQVNDPVVAEKLVPNDHTYGMRRPPSESGYYEAFNRDNVTLVSLKEDPIECLTAAGIKTRHAEYEFDVIIFATGWDVVTGSLLGIDIRGEHGVSLKDKFADGLRVYLHLMSAGFPNLYLVNAATTGGFMRSMEALIDWVGEMIYHAVGSGVTRVVPTDEAEESWMRYAIEKTSEGMIDKSGHSPLLGGNIPGQASVPRALIFESERAIRARRAKIAANGYSGFELSLLTRHGRRGEVDEGRRL